MADSSSDNPTPGSTPSGKHAQTSSRFVSDFEETNNSWFWETDRNNRFVWVSDNFKRLRGIDPEYLYGRSRTDIGDNPENAAQWQEHLSLLQSRKPFRNFEYSYTLDNGTGGWASTSGHPYYDSDGHFAGYRGSSSIVTNIKQIEETAELKIEEERNLLRSLIDNIDDLIFVKDLDSNFTQANKAATDHMLALNPQHSCIIGKSDKDFYTADVAARFFKTEQAMLQSGKKLQDDVFGATNPITGEYRWMLATKSPLRDKSGNIIGLVGTSSDVTSVHQLNLKLNTSQQRFRDFAEAAADWLWECDGDFEITYQSEKYTELTQDLSIGGLGKNLKQYSEEFFENLETYRHFHQHLDQKIAFSNFEIELVHETGGIFNYSLSGKPAFSEEGEFIGYRGVGRDISEAKLLQRKLAYRAHHDVLTGLPNRDCFQTDLMQELQSLQQNDRVSVVGYLDLDQFKIVNDTIGHQAGDQLLCQVARILENQIQGNHVVARLGGDEFGLLFREHTIKQAEELCEKLLEQLSDFRFNWEGRIFDVGGSIGLAVLDAQYQSTDEILSRADLACYAAKERGRNRCHIYTECDQTLIQRQNEMLAATGLRSALEENKFCLYMQPIVKVPPATQPIHHYEILLRMLDDNGEIVPPGAFIPAAERYGLMKEIDRWVIHKAISSFHDVFNESDGTGITVNLSGDSMSDTTLFKFIHENLKQYAVNPERICFEITETAVINNIDIAKQFMSDVKELGCSLALDDFGSGLSSFTYLKHFDVDFLKIDGSFVHDLATDHTDRAVVTAINNIGHSMDMLTIAEFVENDDILKILVELGVDYAQGFGMGMPVPYESDYLGGSVRSAA